MLQSDGFDPPAREHANAAPHKLESSLLMPSVRRKIESSEKTMSVHNAVKFVGMLLLGMAGSPGLSVAQGTTCEVFDVRCPASESAWSGSLTSTSEKPMCLKISRSPNLIPGTTGGDGCVQLVGVLNKGAVTGHYCRANSAIDLFSVTPGSSVELQPDILIGIVSVDEIRGRYYVKKTNEPDEPFSPGPGFTLRRVDACQTK
jgi:hypothetical protein